MTIAVLAGALVAALDVVVPNAPAPAHIPLCPGLTIVTAVQRAAGDYESIKRVTSVTGREVTLSYSTQIPRGSSTRDVLASRTVLTQDLRNASLYMHYFSGDMHVTIPGSTAMMRRKMLAATDSSSVSTSSGPPHRMLWKIASERRVTPSTSNTAFWPTGV